MPVYSRVRRERKEVIQVILVISHRVSVRSGRLQKMETGEDSRGNRVIKRCTVFNPSSGDAEQAGLFELKATLAYK